VAPSNLLLASCAVHQANVMVERLVGWQTRSQTLTPDQFSEKATERRTALASACHDFSLVRDIDNTHRHLKRRRGSERSAALKGGAWWLSWRRTWGDSWGKLEPVVPLDDGTQRPLAAVLANVIEMWDRLLPH
jgi:hypothetical protein